MQSQIQRNPIEIKISTVVAIAVILHDANLSVLASALKKLTAKSSDYYAEECAVIDVANIDCSAMDWVALIDLLRSNGFRPVAIRNAPDACEDKITELGLSIDLGASSAKVAEVAAAAAATVAASASTSAKAKSAPVLSPAPMVIDVPVRGGQRIYARGCDLIITAVVNSGAEVIADGNIHIYAPLKGRALAGASGNTAARIFTTSLEAELVSIAGFYRTFDNGFPSLSKSTPIQIKLDGDKINISSIKIS